MEDNLADLSAYVREFEEADEATMDARQKSERDRDYYDGKQLTSDEEAALKNRGQPPVVYNRVMRKVNALLGLEKQTRKDPKAFPRTPNDEQSAQAATDALRYVCDDNRWDDRRSDAATNLLVEGTGVIFVGVRQTRAGIDPDIRRIAWDRYYFDPHSSEFDFSDKAYDGLVIWMDLDKAKAKWPDRVEALETTWARARASDTYDDKPKHQLWADYKRKRVRICEHYCLKDGVWVRSVFTQGGFLEDPAPSPYIDEEGQPENPIKAVSLYVDRDNNRYGEVRMMISPQDEINKRRSKALHLFTMRQARLARGSGLSGEDARKQLAKPDGIIIADKDEFEILPTGDMAAGNFELLQEAKNEIDLLGPNAALAGKNESGMSGRAILAQQQGGMIEAATFLDRIRCLSLMVYRAAWCRIRQHWNEQRWVRVTDDEQNLRFVGFNVPVKMVDQMAQQMGVTPENFAQFAEADPEGAAELQMLAQSPQGQQVVSMENPVAELDVDIIVDEGIDAPTIAAEQFDQMVKMAGAGLPIPPDVLIEASSLRNKSKLLEMLKQGPSPEQQQMQQIQLEGEAAKVDETKSKTMKNLAQADAALAPSEPPPQQVAA